MHKVISILVARYCRLWTFLSLSLSSALRLQFALRFEPDLKFILFFFFFFFFSTLFCIERVERAPVAGEVVPLSEEDGVVASGFSTCDGWELLAFAFYFCMEEERDRGRGRVF